MLENKSFDTYFELEKYLIDQKCEIDKDAFYKAIKEIALKSNHLQKALLTLSFKDPQYEYVIYIENKKFHIKEYIQYVIEYLEIGYVFKTQ
jgi:hypothetical protein